MSARSLMIMRRGVNVGGSIGSVFWGLALVGSLTGCSLVGDMSVSRKSRPYVHLVRDVNANDLSAVKRDLSAGIDPNKYPKENDLDESALCVASVNGNIPMMNLLMDHGANPNLHDGWYGAPLSAAASANNLPAMKLLISRGAEVNDYGNGSSLALFKVAGHKNLAAMQFLLSHGANPNSVVNGEKKESILSVAKSTKQPSEVALLRRYGAK